MFLTKYLKQMLVFSVAFGVTALSHAQTVTNLLLNADYESNTKNSGTAAISGSHAPAADAYYLVSPGATGNYAIAHKLIQGDPAYFSDGNDRSESDAIAVKSAQYLPGD